MRGIPLHHLPPASSPRPPHMDLLDSPSLPFPYPRVHQQLPQRFLADLHPVLLRQVLGRQRRPKSPYSRFTSFTAFSRTASVIRRFEARPLNRCRIPPSPSFRNREANFRTHRSLSLSCSPASFCPRCPFSTSCKTFSRSRSARSEERRVGK